MNAINNMPSPIFFRSLPAGRRIAGGVAVIAMASLAGCAAIPSPWSAPVEDHSAKAPLAAPAPVAKTNPLPSISEDEPLRAEPLPLPVPPKIVIPESPRPASSVAPALAPSAPTANPSTPPSSVIAQSSATPSSSLPLTSSATPQAPVAITSSVTPPLAMLSPPARPKITPAPTLVQPEIQLPPAKRTPSSSNTGVVALLGKADDLAASGQVDSAAGTLERALSIEPENGRLWHELAGIRLKQGRLDDAVAVATKANSLARNQRELQARNWRLIAVARQKQGQTQAAAEALQRARTLEGSAP